MLKCGPMQLGSVLRSTHSIKLALSALLPKPHFEWIADGIERAEAMRRSKAFSLENVCSMWSI